MVVALLAEGVGRNRVTLSALYAFPRSPSSRRAWVEIELAANAEGKPGRSPSSRRAWVEIFLAGLECRALFVALLAEGVGRNF